MTLMSIVDSIVTALASVLVAWIGAEIGAVKKRLEKLEDATDD